MSDVPVRLICSKEDMHDKREQVKAPETITIPLERMTLEPIQNVGLLGLDKGSWHCGGGMGGL